MKKSNLPPSVTRALRAQGNLPLGQGDGEEKPRKYRNERVKVGKYFFDSKAEHRRYNELKIREQAGEIRNLEIHPAYIIAPAFARQGKAYPPIIYVADFSYKEKAHPFAGKSNICDPFLWRSVVEDVKGVETEAFRVKKKLFLATYPGIIFRVVKRGVITDY
jgi:hypothetical protein